MKNATNFLRIALIVVCLGTAIYFARDVIKFIGESYSNYQNQKRLEELYNRPGEQIKKDEGEKISDPKDNLPRETKGMLNQYKELFDINSDIVGWIDIADGKLSTPVMQKDNEYYLTHDFYNNFSKHGAIFMDERNKNYDDNIILYGHNITSDKSMFNIITNYRRLDYYKQYPTISFSDLFESKEYAIFSVFLASTRPEHGEAFDYINDLTFDTKAEKENYIAELKKHSMLDTGVDVNSSDQLLTLSTCTYEFADGRLAVVARKLREGEKTSDFGKNAKEALNPLMPEIWEKTYGGK